MYELVEKATSIRMPVRLANYGHAIEEGWVDLYPYSNDSWRETVKKFNITIPETIITLAEGITKCNECGATYAGKPWICTNLVWVFEYRRSWNDTREMGHRFVGEQFRDNYNTYKVDKSYLGPCGSHNLSWTLKEAFETQKAFFTMLEHISHIPNSETSILAPYKEILPQYQMIEMNLIRARIVELELRNLQLVGVIKEIASRMSQAGSALNIGNL